MNGAGGGETKASPSSWSVDTLHVHIDRILNDHDRMWMELRSADEKRYTERLLAQKEAIAITAEMAKEAKAAANEWRGAMKDREAMFLPRDEFNAILKEWADWRSTTIHDREALAQRISTIETKMTTWFAAGGVFFTVVQLAIFWLTKK